MPVQPKATLEKLLELLGFSATVEEQKNEDGITLDVKTDDSGRLIGRQGRTAQALRTLAQTTAERDGRKVQVEFRDGSPRR